MEEGTAADSPALLYVHGGRVDEVVAQIKPQNNTLRYLQYDARGHCVFQTEPSGQIEEQYEYDAFGLPYFFDRWGNPTTMLNGQPGSPWGNRILFTGREYLSDMRIYDFRHRIYHPELGRFLQPDPIQFKAGDCNLYRYCHNDPVNKSDPTDMTTLLHELAPSIAKLAESKGMKLLREEYDPSSFGNAIVELASVDFNLRVVRDRDDVRVEISPPDEADWHDLVNILAFLDEEPLPPDTNALGAALSARYGQVAALMTSDLSRVGLIRFEKTRTASFLRSLFPPSQEGNNT